MEEKILEIIKYSTHNEEFWDGENEIYKPIFDEDIAAKEITAHVIEFINDLLMLKIYDWDWGNDINTKKVHHFLNGKEVTFDEVYEHWLDKVKNK